MTIMAKRNMKILILLMPCMTFKLKDDGLSDSDFFQKLR